MGSTGQKIAEFFGAIIVVAIISVLVSSKSQTPSVFGAFFGGLSTLVATAVSPVTGQSPVAAGSVSGGAANTSSGGGLDVTGALSNMLGSSLGALGGLGIPGF